MVVMTGQDDSATTLHSYRLGATSFLAKPIDWPEFTLTIQQILRGSERQAEEEAASAAMRYWLARANRP